MARRTFSDREVVKVLVNAGGRLAITHNCTTNIQPTRATAGTLRSRSTTNSGQRHSVISPTVREQTTSTRFVSGSNGMRSSITRLSLSPTVALVITIDSRTEAEFPHRGSIIILPNCNSIALPDTKPPIQLHLNCGSVTTTTISVSRRSKENVMPTGGVRRVSVSVHASVRTDDGAGEV